MTGEWIFSSLVVIGANHGESVGVTRDRLLVLADKMTSFLVKIGFLRVLSPHMKTVLNNAKSIWE